MGRRKSTQVLEISGAFDHDPARRRTEMKETRPLGEPPARLPAAAREFWDEIAQSVAPGVLKISDRWCVELAARLMQKAASAPNLQAIAELVRTLELSKADAKRLLGAETISSAELNTLRSLLAALGMSPSDRGRLSIEPPRPVNRFDELKKPN